MPLGLARGRRRPQGLARQAQIFGLQPSQFGVRAQVVGYHARRLEEAIGHARRRAGTCFCGPDLPGAARNSHTLVWDDGESGIPFDVRVAPLSKAGAAS